MKQSSGYTIRQTAKLLDVSVQRIYKLIGKGFLVTITDNGQVFVSAPSLTAYIQKRLGEIKAEKNKYDLALKNLLNPIDNSIV